MGIVIDPVRVSLMQRGGRDQEPWLRQLGIAAIVLALHAVILQAMFAPMGFRGVTTTSADIELTWIEVLAPDPESQTLPTPEPAAAPLDPVVRPQTALQSGTAAQEVAPNTAPADGARPTDDAAFAALRPYDVLCGQPNGCPSLAEAPRPCDRVRWELYDKLAAIRAPTAREIDLARRFERDLAVETAPVLLPSGIGVSRSTMSAAR